MQIECEVLLLKAKTKSNWPGHSAHVSARRFCAGGLRNFLMAVKMRIWILRHITEAYNNVDPTAPEN